MSAIGDYVHYTRKGYETHGITRKGGGGAGYEYGDVKRMITERMQEQISKNKIEIAGLENALNFLMGTEDKSEQHANREAIRNQVLALLQERFGESLGKINFDTGDVSASELESSVNSKGQIMHKKLQADAKQQGMYLSTFLTRIRALEAIRDSMKANTTKANLNSKINEMYTLLNQAYNGLKKGQITKMKNWSTRNNQELENKTISIKEGTFGANLITQINAALKEYHTAPAINLQKGDLFEYLIALVPLVSKATSEEELKKLMEECAKSVVGDERSQVKIDFNNFSKDVNVGKLKLSNYIVAENERVVYSYGTSQGKIDVNLKWNNQTIPVSAKNVNLSNPNGVHILSGASLLALIQDLDGDFINHYLNIIAEQHTTRGSDRGDAPLVSGDAPGAAAAHEAMKWTILYQALSGDVYGRAPASVFIVNDNSKVKGGVKVYYIEDLVNKAMQNINAYAKITANDKDLNQLLIANRWSNGSYEDRITNFVSQLHSQKISAALKPALLT